MVEQSKAIEVARDWLAAFAALADGGAPTQPCAGEASEVKASGAGASAGAVSVEEVFAAEAWWRDAVSLTWDLRTFDRAALKEPLAAARQTNLRDLALNPGLGPSLGPDGASAMVLFTFVSDRGRGSGVAHLQLTDAGWRARTVFTQLDELSGFAEAVGRRRPFGGWQGSVTEPSWSEQRAAELEFADADPEVLIIGAGHSGLSLAARLGRVGVRALVVEHADRVGDGWRGRYRSLVLHDPVGANHLPYLPFPSSWPLFTPKDKMGDWLELYVGALDLNVWTSSTVLGARRDGDVWSVEVRRGDEMRTLRPVHVVVATGLSGNRPFLPEIVGAEEFGGPVLHSSAFRSGAEYAGQRVLVVGAGNSGHDLAQDLAEHGAEVTMLQRSATHVVSGETMVDKMMTLQAEGGPATELVDLIAWSVPQPAGLERMRAMTAMAAECDRELLDGLRAAGFGLTSGPGGAGMAALFARRNGGYYVDVGCSRLIVDGTIAVKHGTGIDRLEPGAVVFGDGERRDFDAILLATGYTGILDTARDILGAEAVAACTPVWGLDDEGELRSVWRPSGQEGLWFMGGNLSYARPGSKYLALQLTAALAGLR